MLGPETEGEAIEGTFGSYREMKNGDEEEGFVDNTDIDYEEGQELFLPTVTKYGLVKRYKSNLRKRIQKKKIENEDTLMAHFGADSGASETKYPTIELEKAKSDLQQFLRDAGIDKDPLRASQASGKGSSKIIHFLQEVIEEEFPANNDQIPKGRDLIYRGDVDRSKGMYSPGNWVGKDCKSDVQSFLVLTSISSLFLKPD